MPEESMKSCAEHFGALPVVGYCPYRYVVLSDRIDDRDRVWEEQRRVTQSTLEHFRWSGTVLTWYFRTGIDVRDRVWEEQRRAAARSTFGGWILSLRGIFGQESMIETVFGKNKEEPHRALWSIFGGRVLS